MVNTIPQLVWIVHSDDLSTGIMNAGALTPAPHLSRWKARAGRVFKNLKCYQKYWSNGSFSYYGEDV
jgi:hypothetical protein